MKSLSQSRKSLRGFRKLFRRSLHHNQALTRMKIHITVLSKAKWKKRQRQPIREISAQRLPSPIWPPNWRMSKNSLRPMTCRPEGFMLLSWEWRSSQRSRPGGWKNGFPWRWRRSDSGRVRWPKLWQPQFFDSLWQCSHCLRGGQGRRVSWLISFSLKRPPRSADLGVREIAQWRTSPRCSDGNKSTAWSAWRSLAVILTKAKNTKCCNYNCFFYCDFPEIIRTHLVLLYRVIRKHCQLNICSVFTIKVKFFGSKTPNFMLWPFSL